MSLHTAIKDIPESTRTEYIKDYFSENGRRYSGAHFNSFQFDPQATDRVTVADLYSVNLLALDIPGAAGLAILNEDAQEITDLLAEIPDKPIGELSTEEFDEHLGAKSAAMKLWKLLRRYKGLGAARVSKLMARKRPHLIPIRDSIVVRVAGFDSNDNDWVLWWKTLRGNEELEAEAERLRQVVNQPNLSTLRVFDILLWYSGRDGMHAPGKGNKN